MKRVPATWRGPYGPAAIPINRAAVAGGRGTLASPPRGGESPTRRPWRIGVCRPMYESPGLGLDDVSGAVRRRGGIPEGGIRGFARVFRFRMRRDRDRVLDEVRARYGWTRAAAVE
jgi:hypothetical protein